MMTKSEQLNLLSAFSRAWADRDIAGILACLHDKIVYAASVGPEPGRTYSGIEEVIAGISAMWLHDDATSSETLSIETFGEQAVVRWKYNRTEVGGDGSDIVLGIDLYRFQNGRIIGKDAYRKVVGP